MSADALAQPTTVSDQPAHSTTVGGSTARRRMACPASLRMERQAPIDDVPSAAALEGTVLHSCMEALIRGDVGDPYDFVDRVYEGIVITEYHGQLLDLALSALDEMEDAAIREYGDGLDMLLEHKVQVKGIPEAFGTVDVAAWNAGVTVILDWKFGQNPVSVEAAPTTGAAANEQLMFYGLGLLHTMPSAFGAATTDAVDPDRPVWLVIVQPKQMHNRGEVDRWVKVSVNDLLEFKSRLLHAMSEALHGEPTVNPGDWCTYASCALVCPRRGGAITGLGRMLQDAEPAASYTDQGGTVRPATLLPPPVDMPQGEWIAAALDMADLVDSWAKAVKNAAHAAANAGIDIPGWRLENTRATRQWQDEDKAQRYLRSKGLKKGDVIKEKMVSPAAAEAALKRAGKGDFIGRLNHLHVFIEPGKNTKLVRGDAPNAVHTLGGVSAALAQLVPGADTGEPE